MGEDRRLCKSEKNRLICGVCAGLAEYFGIDVTVVRLVFVALGIFGTSGVWLYLIAAVIMPSGSSEDNE